MKIIRQRHEIALHTRWFSITLSRARQKRLELQRAGIWTMRDGTQIHISQMSDRHLANTIKFLERKAWRSAAEMFPNPYTLPVPRGEMAQDLYWRGLDDFDFLMGLSRTEQQMKFLAGQPIYGLMVQEWTDRGLKELSAYGS